MKRFLLKKVSLAVILLWPSLSFPAGERIISILALADEEFRAQKDWQEEVGETLRLVSEEFERKFGLKFSVGRFSDWDSDDGLTSLEDVAQAIDFKVDKAGCDVVLAFTAQRNLDPRYYGFCLFKEGIVVLRRPAARDAMVRALKHELGHIFGAVHVDDQDSVMDFLSRGEHFDPDNAMLISLNRARVFFGEAFPLPKENWDETARLCREIAGRIHIAKARAEAARTPAARLSFQNLEDVHLLLAQVYLEQKRYEETIAEGRKALRINPEGLESRNLIGIASRRMGRYEEAIQSYMEVLKKKPQHARVIFNLGIAYSKKGNIEAALDAYQTAIAIKPNFAEAFCNMGDVLLRMDKVDEAEKAFLTSLSIYPDYALVRSNLAEVFFRRKDFRRSLEEVEKAIRLNPELPDAYNIRGKIFHEEGDVDRAIREFEKALSLDPGYEKAHYNLGNCYLDKKAPTEAKKMFSKALEVRRTFAEARASLGYCLLLEEKWDEAVAELTRSLELGFHSPKTHLNLSTAYLRKGLADEAAVAAKKAVELDPKFSMAYNNLGLAYLNKGLVGRAQDEFEKALGLDPQNKEALINLGNFHYGQGKVKEALGLFLEALKADPANGVLHNNVAVLYFRMEEYHKSWEHVKKAESLGVKVHPDFVRELKSKKFPISPGQSRGALQPGKKGLWPGEDVGPLSPDVPHQGLFPELSINSQWFGRFSAKE